jgi:predicted ATPase
MLENVRVHRRTELPIGPLTVIVGENNSGKSTLFDGLVNLRALSMGWGLSREGKYTFAAMRRNGDASPISYRLETANDQDLQYIYEVSYEASVDDPFTPTIVSERPSDNRGSVFDRNASAGPQTKAAAAISPSTTLYAAMSSNARAKVYEDDSRLWQARSVAASTMVYRLVPHLIAQSVAMTEDSMEDRRVPYVDSKGKGLVGALFALALHPEHSSVYARLVETLTNLIDGFSGFEFMQSSEPGEVVFGLRFTDDRHVIPASQLSDGTLSLIGLLTILNHPFRPKLICLEEPEAGLTTKALRAVLRAADRATNGDDQLVSQVLISTHSPYLVSWVWNHVGGESIFHIRGHDGSADLSPFVDDFPEVAVGSQLGFEAIHSAMGWQYDSISKS